MVGRKRTVSKRPFHSMRMHSAPKLERIFGPPALASSQVRSKIRTPSSGSFLPERLA